MSGEDGDVVRRDRFSGGPARAFLSSMDHDERLFDADLAVDRAHVVMLAEQGIVDEGSAGAILDALIDVEATGYDALDGEDVHAAIETAVIDRGLDRLVDILPVRESAVAGRFDIVERAEDRACLAVIDD